MTTRGSVAVPSAPSGAGLGGLAVESVPQPARQCGWLNPIGGPILEMAASAGVDVISRGML